MSFVIARSATSPSTFQEGDERTDRYDTPAMSSPVWALLEALAHTGALIDPSGVLAGHRFHRIRRQEQSGIAPGEGSELAGATGPAGGLRRLR